MRHGDREQHAGRNEGEQDPQKQGPTPPLPEPEQQVPGTEGEMATQADHGQDSYRGTGKLEGKVALITGADSGIGKAVAIAYAREGADIVVSYLNEEEDARDTAKWVEKAGRKALLVAGDVSDRAHCKQLVEKTIGAFGRLDILVNNAAFQMSREDIREIPDDEFDFTFRTNVYAMFYLCKDALEHMEAGASIINVSSIQAYQPSPQLLAYAATKGAIVNFTKGLAGMVAQRGIRVNSVAPGPVWTPLIPATMPPEKVEAFGKDTPLGRPAQPAELAPAFVLLASQDGSYISGAVIPVTGGKPTM
jgi:NAD(P)-dependent dehydrogenase (short-subunit alcohol dehydrogenase family)